MAKDEEKASCLTSLSDKLEFENELIGELSATLDEIEVQNNEIPPRVEYTATERAKTLRTFF